MNVRSTRAGAFPVNERDELYSRIRSLIARGESDTHIARVLGISDKTVSRYRRKRGIQNYYDRMGIAC